MEDNGKKEPDTCNAENIRNHKNIILDLDIKYKCDATFFCLIENLIDMSARLKPTIRTAG